MSLIKRAGVAWLLGATTLGLLASVAPPSPTSLVTVRLRAPVRGRISGTQPSVAQADSQPRSPTGQVGTAAPALAMTAWINAPTWHNTPTPLHFGDGHVYILDFTAWWCEACPQNYDTLAVLAQHYAPHDVRVLLVTAFYGKDLSFLQQDFHASQNPIAKAFGIAAKHPVTLPIVVDGVPGDTSAAASYTTNAKAFGNSEEVMPVLVVIDQRGIIRLSKKGLVQDDTTLTALIDTLLNPHTADHR